MNEQRRDNYQKCIARVIIRKARGRPTYKRGQHIKSKDELRAEKRGIK
jgi:hypothetical protein